MYMFTYIITSMLVKVSDWLKAFSVSYDNEDTTLAALRTLDHETVLLCAVELIEVAVSFKHTSEQLLKLW